MGTKFIQLSFIFSVSVFFPFLIFTKGSGIKPYSINELIIWIIILFYSFLLVSSPKKIYAPFAFSIILLICYQVIITFVSPYPMAGITSVLIHDKYIPISFLVPCFINSVDVEKRLLKCLLSVCMAVVSIMLFYVIKNPSVLLVLYGRSGFLVEMSVFPNPNMAGVYIGTLIFIQLLFFEIQKKKIYKILVFLLMICPSMLALILTFSRRAWLGVIMAMAVSLIVKKRNKLIIALIVLFLVVLLSFIDYQTVIRRFFLIFNGHYASNAARLGNLNTTIMLMGKSVASWLGGMGVGISGPGATAFGANNRLTFLIHSYFLQILIEFGLIGLVLYSSVIFIIFVAFLKTYRRYKLFDQYSIKFIVSYMLCIFVLLVASTVGLTPITFPSNMLMWLFVGLILRHYNKAKNLFYLNRCSACRNLSFTQVVTR